MVPMVPIYLMYPTLTFVLIHTTEWDGFLGTRFLRRGQPFKIVTRVCQKLELLRRG